jgi:CubicO group peptidase (beta-lactamase class C family)
LKLKTSYLNTIDFNPKIMKIKILLIAAIVLIFVQNAKAQHDFSKLDTWLANHATEMGGRVILVVYKDGQMVYNHSVDEMNARQKMVDRVLARRQGKTVNLDDYTLNTRQPIASCSKWLSAALVMTFVDEGKLKLDDTVGKFLPILSQHGKGGITIGQCLSHLTGINPPPLKDDLAEMKDISSMDEAIAAIAKLPMEGQPGKVFHYSSAGLQIAGAVLEKISGKSFEALFQERIARPLDMKNTDFGKGKVPVPAGSGVSTPQDYLNFLVMIMNNGTYNGKRILSEASVAAMQVNRVTPDVKIGFSPAEAGNFGYGFGEWTMDGKNSVTSPGLFGSFPWVNNDKKYAAFLMTYYINNKGRNDRYLELKKLTDEAVGN